MTSPSHKAIYMNTGLLSYYQPKVSLAAAAAKSLQSCPTLRDPMDCNPPGSSARGISRQEYWSGLPFPSPCLGWEDPLEKEMAIHSSILAWEIPRIEEPARLQSMGLQYRL